MCPLIVLNLFLGAQKRPSMTTRLSPRHFSTLSPSVLLSDINLGEGGGGGGGGDQVSEQIIFSAGFNIPRPQGWFQLVLFSACQLAIDVNHQIPIFTITASHMSKVVCSHILAASGEFTQPNLREFLTCLYPREYKISVEISRLAQLLRSRSYPICP